jgi:hypothetical protein
MMPMRFQRFAMQLNNTTSSRWNCETLLKKAIFVLDFSVVEKRKLAGILLAEVVIDSAVKMGRTVGVCLHVPEPAGCDW